MILIVATYAEDAEGSPPHVGGGNFIKMEAVKVISKEKRKVKKIIDMFIKEIEGGLERFDNEDAVRSIGGVESFFLDNFDEINKENDEVAQLGFDLQTEIVELESGGDNQERLVRIERILDKIKEANKVH